MQTKGNNDRKKRRDEVQYEQLILELPLHRPPARPRPAAEDERDRGVITIDLY
jgi:hypothetical protein